MILYKALGGGTEPKLADRFIVDSDDNYRDTNQRRYLNNLLKSVENYEKTVEYLKRNGALEQGKLL